MSKPADVGRLLPPCRQHTQRGPKVTALMASNNTAGIAQARKLVEQLKMEANVDRMKVSRHASKPQVVGFCYFLNAKFAHFMQKKKIKFVGP